MPTFNIPQLVYYVIAIGTFVLASWEPMKPVHDLLVGAGGALLLVPHNAPKHAQKAEKTLAPEE